MLEEFQTIDLFPISVYTVLTNLAVSLACGIVIALVYRFIYKGPSYSATYVNSLVLLSLITTLVIMIIGNNLARAFGLVGAMSIIRFRTAGQRCAGYRLYLFRTDRWNGIRCRPLCNICYGHFDYLPRIGCDGYFQFRRSRKSRVCAAVNICTK